MVAMLILQGAKLFGLQLSVDYYSCNTIAMIRISTLSQEVTINTVINNHRILYRVHPEYQAALITKSTNPFR